MASMRDIKRRKSSIQSTQQITKAMKLVSTVKLQRSKQHAENSKPYFNQMYSTVTSMLARSGNINHPYLNAKAEGKKAVIVITSNRGLAGGYNSNVVKTVLEKDEITKDGTIVYGIGKKGCEILTRRGYEIKKEYNDIIESPLYSDAEKICRELLEAFKEGEINEIYLAYTIFKNTVSHIPTLMKLLPVSMEELSKGDSDGGPENTEDKGSRAIMLYEPAEDEALELIIPKYLTSILYGALVEAVASENGARMQAMDSATSNAEEMISKLELQYNRARQGSITQELTEIIAGADAIG